MRVLVCGGRNYADANAVNGQLNELQRQHGRLCVIQGGASGADELAREWAYRQPTVWMSNFPADWEKHGRAAGPIRNQQMIDEGRPDLVIAFPGGKGTADMVRRARKAGIPVQEVRR